MEPDFIPYRLASAHLISILKSNGIPLPQIGVICGSGLSGLSNNLTSPFTVPYSSVPGFPAHCTVPGHKGEMVFGQLGGVPCLCFRGRFHSYEGHSMSTTVLPVRIMRCLGIKLTILTNAAGGLNPTFNVGDVVSIMDHFALPLISGGSPLIGKNDDALGPRFPPTSNAYDESLQNIVLECAKHLKYDDFVKSNGTYCFVTGPQYESRSECNFLRNAVGGDAVGMSTVPEILAAHHSGMKVICLSLITNKVIIKGDEGEAASHKEVLEAVATRSSQIQKLVQQIVQNLGEKGGFLQQLPDLPDVSLHIPSDCDKVHYKHGKLFQAGSPSYTYGMMLVGLVLGVTSTFMAMKH